jgi:hypothetical protein
LWIKRAGLKFSGDIRRAILKVHVDMLKTLFNSMKISLLPGLRIMQKRIICGYLFEVKKEAPERAKDI